MNCQSRQVKKRKKMITLQDLKNNRAEVLEMISEYTYQFSVKADLKSIMTVLVMDAEFTNHFTDLREFVSSTIYNMRPMKSTLHQKLYSK